jgi:hypothetical protein
MPAPIPTEPSMNNSPLATNKGLGLLNMKSIAPRLPTTGKRYCSHATAPPGVASKRGGDGTVTDPSGSRGGRSRGERLTDLARDWVSTVMISSQ